MHKPNSIPQDTVFDPFLFIAFTNDIVHAMDVCCSNNSKREYSILNFNKQLENRKNKEDK